MSKEPVKKSETKETSPAVVTPAASAEPAAASAPADKQPSAVSKAMAKVLVPLKVAVATVVSKLRPPKISKAEVVKGLKNMGLTIVELPLVLIRGDGVDRFAVLGFVTSAALVAVAVPKLLALKDTVVQQRHQRVQLPPVEMGTEAHSEQTSPDPMSLPKEELKQMVNVGSVPALGGYFEVFVQAQSPQSMATLKAQTATIKSALAPLLINLEVGPLFQNEKAAQEESVRVTQEFLSSPQGNLGVAAVILVPVAQLNAELKAQLKTTTSKSQKVDSITQDKHSEHPNAHEHKTSAH